MECYYDQAFIAVRDRAAESSLRVTTLPVARAALGLSRIHPRGLAGWAAAVAVRLRLRRPGPAGLVLGKLTRHGDVAGLLRRRRSALRGRAGRRNPDRVRRDGPADAAAGWTRSYVLRSYGYCKDADPFTALSDTVEPLPWRGMPAFPFDRELKRPADPV